MARSRPTVTTVSIASLMRITAMDRRSGSRTIPPATVFPSPRMARSRSSTVQRPREIDPLPGRSLKLLCRVSPASARWCSGVGGSEEPRVLIAPRCRKEGAMQLRARRRNARASDILDRDGVTLTARETRRRRSRDARSEARMARRHAANRRNASTRWSSTGREVESGSDRYSPDHTNDDRVRDSLRPLHTLLSPRAGSRSEADLRCNWRGGRCTDRAEYDRDHGASGRPFPALPGASPETFSSETTTS